MNLSVRSPALEARFKHNRSLRCRWWWDFQTARQGWFWESFAEDNWGANIESSLSEAQQTFKIKCSGSWTEGGNLVCRFTWSHFVQEIKLPRSDKPSKQHCSACDTATRKDEPSINNPALKHDAYVGRGKVVWIMQMKTLKLRFIYRIYLLRYIHTYSNHKSLLDFLATSFLSL